MTIHFNKIELLLQLCHVQQFTDGESRNHLGIIIFISNVLFY